MHFCRMKCLLVNAFYADSFPFSIFLAYMKNRWYLYTNVCQKRVDRCTYTISTLVCQYAQVLLGDASVKQCQSCPVSASASPSWLQLQGMAEPRSQDAGTLGTTWGGGDGKWWTERGGEGTKRERSNRGTPQSEQQELSHSTRVDGGPMPGQADKPWRSCILWEAHAGAVEKCEEGGAAEKPLLTDHNPLPHAIHTVLC